MTKIEAIFRNKTANINMGSPIEVETTDTDFEAIFRRLMYTYGQVIDMERLSTQTKRYTLLASMQYPDTLETYEMETELTITRG